MSVLPCPRDGLRCRAPLNTDSGNLPTALPTACSECQDSRCFFYDCCNTVILPLSAAIIVPSDYHIWQYNFGSVAAWLCLVLTTIDVESCMCVCVA